MPDTSPTKQIRLSPDTIDELKAQAAVARMHPDRYLTALLEAAKPKAYAQPKPNANATRKN